MNIVRWDSLHDMGPTQEWMIRVLEGKSAHEQAELAQGSWVPAVDIYSRGDRELVLKAELPDMKQDEIELSIDGTTLTLRGERKLANEIKQENFHRIERAYGKFVRQFALPPTVDGSKIAAEYKDGVLTVKLPMREEAKPRTVKVNVA